MGYSDPPAPEKPSEAVIFPTRVDFISLIRSCLRFHHRYVLGATEKVHRGVLMLLEKTYVSTPSEKFCRMCCSLLNTFSSRFEKFSSFPSFSPDISARSWFLRYCTTNAASSLGLSRSRITRSGGWTTILLRITSWRHGAPV
jgi:hypothetical protein